MDTTPKYILMCEKAEEVQRLKWKKEVCGRLIWSKHLQTAIQCDYSDGLMEYEVWLPRQDQLQEMIDKELGHLLAAFFWWATKGPDGHTTDVKKIHKCDTMEQLWLAFVMHEKYQKQWSEDKQEWLNA